MRCYYREKQIFHGNYLDVDIYPVYADGGKKNGRRKKAKPTSEVQQRLNEKYARKKVIHLLNENFSEKDYALHLSYDKNHLPENFDGAVLEEKNFIRRLKRALKRKGIELKYFTACEESSKKGRLHHHMVITGGLSINEIAEIWRNGYIQVKPLQFNEYGISELSNYITKDKGGRKRLSHSRNLKKPAEKQRDGKISKKRVRELHNFDVDARDICKTLYPEYDLADIEPFYNDVNGNYYISLRLYRPEIFRKRRRHGGNSPGQASA